MREVNRISLLGKIWGITTTMLPIKDFVYVLSRCHLLQCLQPDSKAVTGSYEEGDKAAEHWRNAHHRLEGAPPLSTAGSDTDSGRRQSHGTRRSQVSMWLPYDQWLHAKTSALCGYNTSASVYCSVKQSSVRHWSARRVQAAASACSAWKTKVSWLYYWLTRLSCFIPALYTALPFPLLTIFFSWSTFWFCLFFFPRKEAILFKILLWCTYTYVNHFLSDLQDTYNVNSHPFVRWAI